ncbi:MAG: CobW family GTP-binding protein, partial [Aristaeellaceae bacterium]
MVKVNIISGFLGAGKTTLIKKLLGGKVREEKIILLENEYGEVGVDGSFMKDAGITVTEMNSGCICCTLVGDFQKAVDELIEKYHPDRLIIEPSGVGKLSDILAAVERTSERHEMTIAGCATVVDAGKCRMYMKNFGEFFLDQIKTANTIIFSRTQLLTPERVEKSRALVEEQHPGCRIITTPWDDLSADAMLEVIESGKPIELHLDDDDDDDDDEHDHEHHHHHDHEHDEHCSCHDHDHEHHH